MLQKYYEQLQKLGELLSSGRKMDFPLYLQTIKLTITLILKTIGGLAAIVALVAAPIFVYRKIGNKYDKLISGSENMDVVKKALRQRSIAQFAFFAVLIVLYVPFAIPTVLLFL